MTDVGDLLAAGRLERVPADREAALIHLARAEQHLSTAAGLVGQDNEVAHGSLYDAARIVITAHVLAHGLRATARARAHETVGLHAVGRIVDGGGSVARFDRLRRRRNRSEYDDLVLGDQTSARTSGTRGASWPRSPPTWAEAPPSPSGPAPARGPRRHPALGCVQATG